MTDEELKSIEQTTALLVENGFVIKDTANFIREIGSSNLEDVINKLSGLQKSINEGVNAEIFGKDIAVSLDSIEEVVSSDPYFRTSPEAASFENLLNNLRDKSSKLFRNTLKAEEILRNREENLKDIQSRISKLKLDKTIDDVTRTTETIKLSYALNHAKKAKEEALEFYNDQKELSASPLMADDIIEFKNELLAAVNALDSASRKLSMEPSKMDALAANIRDTRDKIVLFGFETQKNQKEYERLCAKFGLDKADSKTVVKETVLEEEPVKETLAPEVAKKHEENLKPEFQITELGELISELKRLNPEIDVIRDGDTDGILTEDPSKLVLPEGFKYTEGLGVNNKKNDIDPYISAFVKTKEKTLDSSSSEKTNDAEKTAEPAKEEVKEPKKESRVPRGVLAVKRTRRAIVAPYVKAILCYGALGGVMVAAAGVGLSAIGTGMLVGAGVGAIGQKIYHKMINSGAVVVPNADFEKNSSYEIPVVGSYILKDAKSLLDSLRKNKNKKKTESVEAPAKEEEKEVQEQIAENAPEVKAREATETEDKKDELYETYSSMLSENLDREVEALDKPEVLNENINVADIPIEQYQMNSENNFGYEDPSRGGR